MNSFNPNTAATTPSNAATTPAGPSTSQAGPSTAPAGPSAPRLGHVRNRHPQLNAPGRPGNTGFPSPVAATTHWTQAGPSIAPTAPSPWRANDYLPIVRPRRGDLPVPRLGHGDLHIPRPGGVDLRVPGFTDILRPRSLLGNLLAARRTQVPLHQDIYDNDRRDSLRRQALNWRDEGEEGMRRRIEQWRKIKEEAEAAEAAQNDAGYDGSVSSDEEEVCVAGPSRQFGSTTPTTAGSSRCCCTFADYDGAFNAVYGGEVCVAGPSRQYEYAGGDDSDLSDEPMWSDDAMSLDSVEIQYNEAMFGVHNGIDDKDEAEGEGVKRWDGKGKGKGKANSADLAHWAAEEKAGLVKPPPGWERYEGERWS